LYIRRAEMKLCSSIVIAVVMILAPYLGVGPSDHAAYESKPRVAAVHQLGRCPVCGGKADEKIGCVYEARIFNVCSPECASKFEENPLKYLAKMRDSL
jgi:YHS domain-containing protein